MEALIPSTFENDEEFAHSVASSLNTLVDKGVLSNQEVSNAPDHVITEYISRYSTLIQYNQDFGVLEKKVKTLFSPRKEVNPNELIEQIYSNMRHLLYRFKKDEPTIQGFVIFGSSIDPHKTPRPDSDIDLIIVTSNLPPQGILGGPFPILDSCDKLTKYAKSDYPDWRFAEISVSMVTNQLDFYTHLNSRNQNVHMPYWAWNPHSTYFVGELDIFGLNINEEQGNKLLQSYLNSQEIMDAKSSEIEDIRRIFRQKNT